MSTFLDAINFVSGPLTLVAFLAVVVLALFSRSVSDRRGLRYVYDLFREKLTKEQFYVVTQTIINRVFWIVLVFFVFSILAFLLTSAFQTKSQPSPVPGSDGSEPSPVVSAKPTESKKPEAGARAARPQIKNVIVADASDAYRVEITAFNPADRDVFVDEVAISAIRDSDALCCCPERVTFVLSDRIAILDQPDSRVVGIVGSVSTDSESLSGYQVPARGRYSADCLDSAFSIVIDTSLILPSESYSTVLLDVPKRLRISNIESPGLTNHPLVETVPSGLPSSTPATGERADQAGFPDTLQISLLRDMDALGDRYRIFVTLSSDVGAVTFDKSL